MKLSVCIDEEYLSHPIGEKKLMLFQHSIDVATKTEYLLSLTKFHNEKLGYYAGLLHDFGKLNPFYQILFRAKKSEREILQKDLELKYEPVHSPFSSWIAEKLLEKRKDIDYRTVNKIIILIYGHHSKLRKSLGEIEKRARFRTSQNEMIDNLRKFSKTVSTKQEFSDLSWDNCLSRFADPVSFDITLGSGLKSDMSEFLELSIAYSCLLQSDRGSFSEWIQANFNQQIDTSKLIKTASKLSSIRTDFQNEVMANHKFENPITIINAPTGIGKTKVFLDLITKFKQDTNIERIFYFSPLLALTEDFERKVASVIENIDDVLIYNHLFSGSLEEKKLAETGESSQSEWVFENESFNRQFVITTTQRLLITLYSNRQRAKLKLASFRNSLLIVDEVQTIPKYILQNLISILERMNEFLGTKTILVSATIPHELRHLPTTKISEGVLNSYLDLTKKELTFDQLSLSDIDKNRTLIMANTRRKAAKIFTEIVQKYPDALYLSSGIRKRDRTRILGEIGKINEKFILVSTQVVEAGVDVSFTEIFRETAPLDSIVQVMGRLNREGENDKAKLTVYEYDHDYLPYSQLEFNESVKILKEVKDSVGLYSSLPQYYESISEKNNLYKKHTVELNSYMLKLDFDATWDFINRHVFLEDERDSILIPDINEWEEVKQGLTNKNRTRRDYRKYSYLTASLPKSIDKLRIRNYFDPDLLEQNILLPKKEYLNIIYDPRLGTDKWLIQQ
jgi:CRISPR-associated helicase Cas3/CRISPR-associated endonuclease Cas3-HD